jgi:hypothetical protein
MKLRPVVVIIALLSATLWSSAVKAGLSKGGPSGLGSFSNVSLLGTYACSGQGYEWTTPAGGSSNKQDYSFVAASKFGGGNESGTLIITFGDTFDPFGGGFCTFTTSGTYQVNPDGSGFMGTNGTATYGNCGDFSEIAGFVVDSPAGDSLSIIPIADYTSGGTINSNVYLQTCVRQD